MFHFFGQEGTGHLRCGVLSPTKSGDSAPSMGSVLFDLMGNTPKKEEERNEKDFYRGIVVCRGTYGD